MADGVIFQSSTLATPPADTKVSADEGGSGFQVQRVKLAYSADGSEVHVPADADGLRVNLGPNNDVTITGTVTVDGSGSTQPVSAASLPLPTGAASAANQATIAGHLDGVETLLGTIDADTSALAAAVAGSEVQVDIVAPLPAGTNTIGKLAANSGVDIGDVDVASLPATVHSADFDTGGGTDTTLAFGIAVPASGGAAVVPGDAVAGLKVDLGADNDVTVASSALPTGAATAAHQSTIIGHLDGVEGLLATIDADTGVLAAAVAGTEVQVDVVTSALPTGASTAANQATIIGHVDGIETLLGTIDADTGSIATSASTLAGAVSGSEMQVDVLTLPTATVQGDVADDAADSGNPVKIGGRYAATPPTYTDGDRTTMQVDSRGSQAVILRRPDSTASLAVTDGDAQATATLYGVLARGELFNGTTWDRMRGDTANGLDVDVTRSALPTGASTLAEQQSQTTHLAAIATDAAAIETLLTTIDADTGGILTAVQTLDNAISGNEMQVDVVAPLPAGTNNIGDVDVLTLPGIAGSTAHDASGSSTNPVAVGGYAAGSAPAAVTAGDIVRAFLDLAGRQVVAQKSDTATLSNVAGSASSVTLLAANAARLGAVIVNDSTAVLYIKFGSSASTSSFTVELPGTNAAGIPAYYEVPFGYTGIITGIWGSASGNARVTELT